tara:strand:+ start:1374 stop:2534 length:1161 start_codon:yes stop_codon:yes gene_type:complete
MSNLLDKSSILITPTAYNVSEILSMKPSDGSGDADFSRNSGATRTTQDLLIETVTNNIPRIDYSGGVGSWKFEPQSTNQLLSSNNLTSNWSHVDVNAEYGFLSPDGTNNASKLTATGTDPYAFAYSQNITSQDYTGSAYIKGIGSSIGQTGKIWIIIDNVHFLQRVFTITGDWQRVSITEQLGVTVSNFLYIRLDLPDSNPVIGEQVLVWGAQLENLLYPTSYVPTSGAASTRLGDVAINSGNSSLINSNEGVLYTEFYTEADSTDKRICLSDGTSSNRVVLYITATNTLAVFVQNSNGVQVSFSSSITLGQYNKAAFKYKENDFSLFLNGTQVGTDTIGEVPSGLDRLNFSNSAGTSLNFYGRVKSTAVYKEALTDAELTCLTTI